MKNAVATQPPNPSAKSMRAGYAMLALCGLYLAACEKPDPVTFQGYAEAEYVRVAAPFAGNLVMLSVRRGAQVKTGEPLFTLESESESAAKREAQERLRSAEARLENLKTGKRPQELDVVEAQISQAKAAGQLSLQQLKRQQRLHAQGFISREKLDEARTAYERDRARVQELKAQAATARLAAREDEIRAAEAEVAAAKAVLAQSEWRLEQKSVTAPVDALVHDTLYVQGEWVPAGSPVVSLLPPTHIKLRFFVPETAVGSIALGQSAMATCDGCESPIAARVSYVSPSPEYTPPIIYSRELRAKLVFLIEAIPVEADATRLHPGQPVEVSLQ